MRSIEQLHARAKRAISAGEAYFRKAAGYLADAQKLGASQRQSAKAIGRSPAWVNQLLKWQQGGCKGTPFGPQSKAKRARVQAPEQQTIPPPTSAEQAQAQTAKANAERAKAEAAKAQADAKKARAEAVARMFGPQMKTIPDHARVLLIKALRMLASERAAERASAALIVENQRARLNLAWEELIVPAETENKMSNAA
jgi:hypothetical protein